jgi:hypothetical protein
MPQSRHKFMSYTCDSPCWMYQISRQFSIQTFRNWGCGLPHVTFRAPVQLTGRGPAEVQGQRFSLEQVAHISSTHTPLGRPSYMWEATCSCRGSRKVQYKVNSHVRATTILALEGISVESWYLHHSHWKEPEEYRPTDWQFLFQGHGFLMLYACLYFSIISMYFLQYRKELYFTE